MFDFFIFCGYNVFEKGYRGVAILLKYVENESVFNYLKNKPSSHYKIDNEGTIHFYVNDRIFAIISNTHSIEQLTLRLKPELSDTLRKNYKYIIPSYEFVNSFHWSTMFMKAVDNKMMMLLIDFAYDLTVEKMTKRQKFKLELELDLVI